MFGATSIESTAIISQCLEFAEVWNVGKKEICSGMNFVMAAKISYGELSILSDYFPPKTKLAARLEMHEMTSQAAVPDPIYILRGSEDTVTCLSFPGSSSEFLYSGSVNGTLYVWDMKTKRVVQSFKAHGDRSVLSISFLPGGQLITQGRDGCVQFWSYDKTSWTRSGNLKSSSLGFCSNALLRDCSNIAVPSDIMSQVDIYDISNKQYIGKLRPTDGDTKFGTPMSIKSVANNSNQSQLVIGYENGSIVLWDTRIFKMVDSLKCHEDSVMCMCYSKDFHTGFSASVDTKIQSWKISNFENIQESSSVSITNPGLNEIVTRDDQKILATAGWDSKIRIFGLKKLRPLAVLAYHKESVQCVGFSSDNYLAGGSKDRLISIWKVY
ncbi:hypothetical protein ScPMuIL_011888 [Solemya velum]